MNELENYYYNNASAELDSARMVTPLHLQDRNLYSNVKARYWLYLPALIIGVNDWRPRLGTFDSPWTIATPPEYQAPEFKYITDSFSDLADQRAIEIANNARATNREILIMWSGGIDSTAVLASFIKNLSTADLAMVKVLLNSRSIFENSQFFINQINNKIDCIHYSKLDLTPEFFKHYILVHGDPADCLQGPSIPAYWKFMQNNQHKEPWKNHIKGLIASVQPHESNPYYVEGFGEWFVNAVSDNIEQVAPDSITTITDWWWWTYYNFKWQFSCQRPLVGSRQDRSTAFDQELLNDYAINTYFNTDQWQQWSYSNLKTLIPAGTGWEARKYHKVLAREYIYELDRNDVYFETKLKVGGAPNNIVSLQTEKNQPVLYNQHWQAKYKNEPGITEILVDRLENFK